MSKLSIKYEEFKARQAEYVDSRRALLREPEEKLSAMADDLGVHALREQVQVLLKKKLDKAWRLYRKVWDGEPTEKDIDTLLELADEIITYDDFITKESIKVWMVTRDLVLAFKQVFKGTQDKFDQKNVEEAK